MSLGEPTPLQDGTLVTEDGGFERTLPMECCCAFSSREHSAVGFPAHHEPDAGASDLCLPPTRCVRLSRAYRARNHQKTSWGEETVLLHTHCTAPPPATLQIHHLNNPNLTNSHFAGYNTVASDVLANPNDAASQVARHERRTWAYAWYRLLRAQSSRKRN